MTDDQLDVIARTQGVLGDLCLRTRRTNGKCVTELISDGVFLMDTADASTERALASLALSSVQELSGLRVVVAGLGLGFTLEEVLSDNRVSEALVVEIEPALVKWISTGDVPGTPNVLLDGRVSVRLGDVLDVMQQLAGAQYDAILLDVDNGPDFLTHPDNARLYSPESVAIVRRALKLGGVCAVWSAEPSEVLAERLSAEIGDVTNHELSVRRNGRDLTYTVYVCRKMVKPVSC